MLSINLPPESLSETVSPLVVSFANLRIDSAAALVRGRSPAACLQVYYSIFTVYLQFFCVANKLFVSLHSFLRFLVENLYISCSCFPLKCAVFSFDL